MPAQTFPRDAGLEPNGMTWPQFPRPLVSLGQSNKAQLRSTLQVGRVWTEAWKPLDATLPAVRAFLGKINRWSRAGELISVRPYHFETRPAGGTVASGSTGTVSGAGQIGTTLVTTGWPAGTFTEGDYLVIDGFPYALDIAADTASGTFTIDPPIFEGTVPDDGAVVTLNGLLTCWLRLPPRFPEHLQQTDYVGGLSITFMEAVAVPA